MTVRIRFDEMVLQTETERVIHRFDGTITPVIGPVGSGKTSFLELLRYGLGGNGKLSGAVESAVLTVTVRVTFDRETLIFARRIGASTVDVHDGSGILLETFATRNSKHHRLISHFLLQVAGLPQLTVARRAAAPGRKVDNLTFADVYRYCYLSQSEIDRSVVRHDDSIRGRNRKATFEMLFGLSDVETAASERVVAGLLEELSDARREETAVRRFLERAGEASEVELNEERARVLADIDTARAELNSLRSDMRTVTADEAGRQQRVALVASEVRGLNERAILLQAQLRDHATAVAQYELQLEGLARADAAREVLDHIEFSRCPRCLQDVGERAVEPGHCLLCTQLEPPRRTFSDLAFGASDGQLGFGTLAVNDERRRIQALRDEVLDLAKADRGALEEILGDQRAAEVAMRELLADLDRRTEEYVSPRFEAIRELSARLANGEARADAIEGALRYWTRFREIAAQVVDLGEKLEDARRDAEEARAALEQRRAVVLELSDAFDDQVRRLEPPWYDGARIDTKSYLPVLNGQDFDTLSGGEKTMVNVAYHLALLTVALARRDTLLPALLVIDTPRKNLGSGYDQSYAERIYRQIRALADAHPGRFQLVIADNDPPAVALPDAGEIHFDYEHPLVPGIAHPGPGVTPLMPDD